MRSHPRWTAADLPDQSGRTVLVTGASSGIGAVAARHLAAAGAHVVLAVRDEARGARAAATMPGSTEVRRLDLADLSSVRGFVAGWNGELDVLINNAGVMVVPEGRTRDGFETQLGTNHLGPFALTTGLLPYVTDRVVTVASTAHRAARLDLDDLQWQRRPYRRWRVYGTSKLANLLFALELQRRLTAAGSRVRSLAAHPGYSATNLTAHTGVPVATALMGAFGRVFAQSAERGALPTLYAATLDVPGGSYVGPDGPGEHRGFPTLVGRTPAASDLAAATRLWELSERLTAAPLAVASP